MMIERPRHMYEKSLGMTSTEKGSFLFMLTIQDTELGVANWNSLQSQISHMRPKWHGNNDSEW
jgi:hypothetical protein